MMKLLDGKTLAAKIREGVRARVAERREKPGLAILLAGEDPASHLYVNLKERACAEVGIYFEKFLFDADTTTETLVTKVRELNARTDIHGILVQLPLPEQDEDTVIAAIDPTKDVDGFHPANLARLERGEPCLAPATALGIMKLIDASGVGLAGKKAVMIGSELFTRPLRALLREHGVDLERLDPEAPDLLEQSRKADIVIIAVGKPGILSPDGIKDGAIVIDVGTTRANGKILGDVAPEVIEQKEGWITPVPGGVGPMTVAMLLQNVFKAAMLKM